ncbi:aspartate/glutamate racemase family protein [Flavobacterium sp. ANB]|uniref:aspartate/glutamate racemase family protein n=1 Tax=unclassified Flavobacterium TaxID=196869 RepID=UPI0012BA3572|nr:MULTISPECIES: aspartate/glutamate racemase family protein [unclassified Flavobacterium]MBF4517150.1 aspartate/glutamate racemase family protein [Flavobacterium sp. ANB]MTD71886.1 amino acid racemase [Flavobacterium sp. LC2016-13]
MKTIGLIGGMSWESSALYYQIINRGIQEKLGGVHSAKSLLYSVDFDEIAILQKEEKWDKLGELMVEAAQKLEKAGADFIVLCTNTMHKLSDEIEKNVSIPLLHIVDTAAEEIVKDGIKKIGLLGTSFTMEQAFFKDRLLHNHKIETIIPNEKQRANIHQIIYGELVKGIISNDSRNIFLEIITDLVDQGAEGIILGCTEIELLVTNEFTNAKLFKTAEIHAKKAVEFALK